MRCRCPSSGRIAAREWLCPFGRVPLPPVRCADAPRSRSSMFKHDSKRDRFKIASNRTQSCDHLHRTRTCPVQGQALGRMWPVSVSTWLVRIRRMPVAHARHWAGLAQAGLRRSLSSCAPKASRFLSRYRPAPPRPAPPRPAHSPGQIISARPQAHTAAAGSRGRDRSG
jgi:hypothetical protein